MKRDEQDTTKGTTTTPEHDTETSVEEPLEDPGAPTTFQAVRTLLEKARRTQQPITSRSELSRDKSKSLFLLVAVCFALILIFFTVFSTPKTHVPQPGETVRGTPSLGRKTTPGQEQNDPSKALTPMLSADVRQSDNDTASQVTPQDVGGTSRTYGQSRLSPSANPSEKPAPGKPGNSEQYALRNVDFSDPAVSQASSMPTPPRPISGGADSELKKPSMVFVRTGQSMNRVVQSPPRQEGTLTELLPTGTRLMARLEAPVSSALPAPVIAVIEYSYERNGEIVLPAGAKVLGKVSQVTPTGFVGFQFESVEMPDGGSEKIDATAMDLKFGPIKGNISGRNRGKNFLIRSVTGIGTVASYLVGGQGTTGFNGPISENSLLRERLANNVGTAGQEEINALAVNQSLVVTVPGNTRFYIVIEKPSSVQPSEQRTIRSADRNNVNPYGNKIPSLEELRELMQLKNELNQMYFQTNPQTGQTQQ
jgi:Bacterial conjugation TrbI-like protein